MEKDKFNIVIDILFCGLILFAVLFGIYRFFISRNFIVSFQTDCDPTKEICFIGQCDASLGECTGREEDDIWYYSKVKKMAYDLKECNPQEEDYPNESVCDRPVSQHCWIEKCNPSNLEKNEKCITPDEYLAKHPDISHDDGSDENSDLIAPEGTESAEVGRMGSNSSSPEEDLE